MINKLEFKTLDHNECCHPHCYQQTTPEGFACRTHWDWVPPALKRQGATIRAQIARAIWAKDNL